MEKKLFFLLNLHLLTERQLFYLLCIITIINMLIIMSYLYYKRYFVELSDMFLLAFCIIFIAYILFLVDHVTFFATLIYLHLFLVIFF
jgi:hypothetical protein